MKRTLLALAAVAALVVAGLAIADRVHLAMQISACRSTDPAVRIETLKALASARDARAAHVVGEILQSEQNRQVLEEAGYAAARLRDKANLPLILARAEQPPDDETRARLLLYAARLAEKDPTLADNLRHGLTANHEPWRQVGSAAALLYLGHPEAGPALIAIARNGDHPGRQLAYHELKHIGCMMTETVGWPIVWPDTLAQTAPSFWQNLSRFWQANGTARLLNDVLVLRYSYDPNLYELKRLLHARDKVARWFQ